MGLFPLLLACLEAALLLPQSLASGQQLPSSGAGGGVHEPGCGWVLEELVAWPRSQVQEDGPGSLCLERMTPRLCEGGCEVGPWARPKAKAEV